jgi:hypothetical protein
VDEIGFCDGCDDGIDVGSLEVGLADGCDEGEALGCSDGCIEG